MVRGNRMQKPKQSIIVVPYSTEGFRVVEATNILQPQVGGAITEKEAQKLIDQGIKVKIKEER
jgi:predicted transcriptional regulator